MKEDEKESPNSNNRYEVKEDIICLQEAIIKKGGWMRIFIVNCWVTWAEDAKRIEFSWDETDSRGMEDDEWLHGWKSNDS